MKRRLMAGVILLALAVATEALGLSSSAAEPFLFFNVFSLGDIGAPASPYQSDFQGTSGAAGSAWFSSMSLNDLGGAGSVYSFYGGETFTFTGAVNHGGIEIGGNVDLTSASVQGSIVSGGNITANGGSADGDATAAGTITLTFFSVAGTTTEGVPFSPTVDLSAVADFYLERSAHYGSLPPTGSPSVGGQIVFTGGAGTNVFFVSAADVDAAWGVRIDAPESGTVVVNVTGTSAAVTEMDWQLDGGITTGHVLVNFPEATSLAIHGVALLGNVLAPAAAAYFPAGLVVGGLWVGDLQGGGQVNLGGFEEPETPTSTAATSWGAIKKRFR